MKQKDFTQRDTEINKSGQGCQCRFMESIKDLSKLIP